MRNRVYVIAALGLLAACHNKADQGRSATGEVLQGTVSDAMIPLDKLTSEAPLAPASEQNAASGAKPSAAASGQPGAAPSGTPSAEASAAADSDQAATVGGGD